MSKIRDFLQDENGDRAVVNGDWATVADAAAVPQGIGCRVALFKGEYWLDQSKGVPYFDDALIKNPDPLVVRAIVQKAILETPDVTECMGASLKTGTNRHGTISYQAADVYGSQIVRKVAV